MSFQRHYNLASTLTKCGSPLSILFFTSMSLLGCPDATNTGVFAGQMAGGSAGGSAGDFAGMPAGELAGEPAGELAGNEVEYRQLGDPCTSLAQCESGICFSEGIDEDGICTNPCDGESSECPLEGFGCRETTSFGYICIPLDPMPPCSSCSESYECGDPDDYCIFFPEEGQRFCTSGCDDDSECAAGYSCTFMGGERHQCFPDNGLNQCDIIDSDSDGVVDDNDNCPQVANPDQSDEDDDDVGDACDLCINVTDTEQLDTDNDGYGDACDVCPMSVDPNQLDEDGDGFGNACDNCPQINNPDQADTNGNGVGDACTLSTEVSFSIGSPVSASGRSSNTDYTLVGGMLGAQRAAVLNGPAYQLRPYP